MRIGGRALLGTSVLTGLFVGIGKSQVAQRAAKKREDNIDLKKMNKGTPQRFITS
jgi:hypothetical protein